MSSVEVLNEDERDTRIGREVFEKPGESFQAAG